MSALRNDGSELTDGVGGKAGLVSRLAPSPTGVLHLGNARTFLLNWLHVRAAGGTLLLRVEDIDGPRVREGAELQALEDLRWLGLDWDGVPIRQSDRLGLYREAADRLCDAGLAYPCVCSRKEVEVAASAPHESWQDAVAYPGTCRGRWRSREEARAATGREPALRFGVEVAALAFDDLFRGPEAGDIRGDFVIEKRDGGPAYQLAVVVDDAATGVTLAMRGDDLLASTPRQLLLYRALGLDPAPQFAHLPLLVGPDGRRLAKRHGDTSLRAFREAGVSATQLVGYLAMTAGIVTDHRAHRPEDLLEKYALASVPSAPFMVRSAPLDGA